MGQTLSTNSLELYFFLGYVCPEIVLLAQNEMMSTQEKQGSNKPLQASFIGNHCGRMLMTAAGLALHASFVREPINESTAKSPLRRRKPFGGIELAWACGALLPLETQEVQLDQVSSRN